MHAITVATLDNKFATTTSNDELVVEVKRLGREKGSMVRKWKRDECIRFLD